jgi:hypothetical protein
MERGQVVSSSCKLEAVRLRGSRLGIPPAVCVDAHGVISARVHRAVPRIKRTVGTLINVTTLIGNFVDEIIAQGAVPKSTVVARKRARCVYAIGK